MEEIERYGNKINRENIMDNWINWVSNYFNKRMV